MSEREMPKGHVEIAHDGFEGDIIGHYTTREGKHGVVVQQDGTRVVHVYGEKWLASLSTEPASEEDTKRIENIIAHRIDMGSTPRAIAEQVLAALQTRSKQP